VRLRGSREGLILSLPAHAPFTAVLGQVRSYVDGGGQFFRDGEVVIDYGDRTPNVEEIIALKGLLTERGVRLRTVVSGHPPHRDLLRSWGYHPLRLVEPPSEQRDAAPVTDERVALYVRRTLRSGASVQADGDIVVFGDVNAGAEVIAGGDVMVWGAIRGTVHAGATGDVSAVICALRLQPTQLRIANIFARPPDQRAASDERPMVARIDQGEIVVESWRPDRRPGR
jgi:septum site-determining protein MinC